MGLSQTPQALVPAAFSSGSMTLISRQTFSNVASISFANVFTTTYENYLIYFSTISTSSETDNFQLQLQTSGGVQTSNYYGNSIMYRYDNTTLAHTTSNNAAAYDIQDRTGSSCGQIHITGSGAGANGRLCWTGSATDTGSGEGSFFEGTRNITATYTGISFKSASQNITGTIAIYGLVKS